MATSDILNTEQDPQFTLERLENWKLRRRQHVITFRITNGKENYDYRMHLLPETYSLDRPARTTVVQTRGGVFIDHFGVGIGTLTISGTTGFKVMPNNSPAFNPQITEGSQELDGFDRWKGLNNFFETWYQWNANGVDGTWQMHFLNWSENDQFVVWPIGMPRLSRNVREPLMFRYDIQLTVIDRVAKLPYLTRGQQVGDDATDNYVDLKLKGQDRAPLVEARLKDQALTLQALVGHILNAQDVSGFDPANPTAFANPYDDLDDDTRDAVVQGYFNTVLTAQTPGNYNPLPNNPAQVVAHTRKLAQQISDFATGKTTKIDATLGQVQVLVNGWRDVLDAVEYATRIPVVLAREVKETLCAVQSLLLYPQLFKNSVSAALTELADLLLDSGCATTIRR